MTLATNTIDSSPSLPALAAIQRRRRELLAFQAWQRPAQATAPPGEPLAAEDSCLEEESCLAQEPEEPHPAKDPEPSPALPSQASAPGPPTLADPALYGLAGLAVRSLSPHTEADRRLFFDASPIDPTAQRISEALDATPQGLTRGQIRGLFHRHLSRESIDLALEQLTSLGLINRHTLPGRGRPCGPQSKTPKPPMRGLKAHRALKGHTSPRAATGN
jgi:hypothetical protein